MGWRGVVYICIEAYILVYSFNVCKLQRTNSVLVNL